MARCEMLGGEAVGQFASRPSVAWVQAGLETPVVLWGGWPFFQRGWASVIGNALRLRNVRL